MDTDESSQESPHDVAAELAGRYARAVDTGDVELFVGAFAPDAVLTVHRPGEDEPRSVYEGHENLARIPPALRHYLRTDHVVGDVQVISATAGLIEARVPCSAHHVSETPDGLVDTVMTILYHDTYRRPTGEWLIVRREVRTSVVDTVALDDRPEPDAGIDDGR